MTYLVEGIRLKDFSFSYVHFILYSFQFQNGAIKSKTIPPVR